MSVPTVSGSQLVFTLDDPERTLVGVTLDCDDALAGRRRFRRTRSGWLLRIPRPTLGRLEYRLALAARDGSVEVVCDPENPARVRTAFGERSVGLLPGYEPPAWLSVPAAGGSRVDLTHHDEQLGDLPIALWSADGLGPEVPAPLLVVHDGPEYADLAALTTYCGAMVATDRLPPFRAALMQPVHRDEWYAASPDYVAAELQALDTVGAAAAISGRVVVMGASLGGLTALLVGLQGEPRVGGVFSQSGSFFRQSLDSQESNYPFFSRVVERVESIAAEESSHERPLDIAMTCGRVEENWANNVAMAELLEVSGHRVRLQGVDDLHNYTAWRDGLDPLLTDVLRSVWLGPG